MDMEPYQEKVPKTSPSRMERHVRKQEIIETISRLQEELDMLNREDANEISRLAQEMAEEPRQSFAVSRYMQDQDGLPYGFNPESHGNSHHRNFLQDLNFPRYPELERDRNAQTDLSASSTNMPSPPETVDHDSPQPGRDGSPRILEEQPQLPVLAPDSRTFGGAPIPVPMAATGRNPKPMASRSRETQDRTYVCPQIGCKSSFHRECELRYLIST